MTVIEKKTFPSMESLALVWTNRNCSSALELMLAGLLILMLRSQIYFLLIIEMYAYVHYKGLQWNFLRLKKVTDKVGAPKSVNTVAAALCPSMSELRGRHSQHQMVPRLPHSPNISRCQVSIAIKSLQMKTRIMRTNIKQIKGFYSLSDCKAALKCRTT